MFLYSAINQMWSQQHKLIPSDDGGGFSFGEFLALQNGIILGGALYDDEKGTDAGILLVENV